jgi:hypothetical protein
LSSEWIATRGRHLVNEIARPHRWQPSKRLAAGGVGALAALCAVTVALVLSLAGAAGTSTAFAGWTAKPTTPRRGQIQAAQAGCNQPDQPTLADTRGPYAVLLYNTPGQPIYACTAFPAASGTQFVGWTTNQQTLGSSLAANTIAVAAHGMRTDAADRSVYQHIYGYAGGDVTSVTLTLNDGTQVQATTENGLFDAWWPGTEGVQTANVIATTGTSTQTLNIPSVTLPPGIFAGAPAGGSAGSGTSTSTRTTATPSP